MIHALRVYCVLMCLTGVISIMVDGWLYAIGAITRRLNARVCLLMGLLWPVFLVMLGVLLWKTRPRADDTDKNY